MKQKEERAREDMRKKQRDVLDKQMNDRKQLAADNLQQKRDMDRKILDKAEREIAEDKVKQMNLKQKMLQQKDMRERMIKES